MTDIANKAGYARHTFYNHYETKDELLNSLLDTVLDQFFANLAKWDFFADNPEEELRMYTFFFQEWKDNPEIVRILNQIDAEYVLVKRLKAYFTRHYYERVSKEIPKARFELAKYIISFSAYTLLGVLKPWLKDGMKHPPEVMAGFLLELTGSAQRRQAVSSYMDIMK